MNTFLLFLLFFLLLSHRTGNKLSTVQLTMCSKSGMNIEERKVAQAVLAEMPGENGEGNQ